MASEIKVDTISENTSANGVTIDGVLIKDGQVDGVDVSTLSVDTNGLVLVDSSLDVSGATDVTFDNVFTSSYQFYKLIFTYEPSVTADFRMVFRNGGASGSDITANYDSKYTYLTTSATSYTMGTSGSAQSYITLMNGSAATADYGLNIDIWNPFESTKETSGFMQGSWKDGGQLQTGFSHDSEVSVTGFKLYPSTGTMSGDYLLYGYKV